MTSGMTSHATIGNSTFAEPRSADTTMSSIDGPSDFTENMFAYMKGNKQTTAKKSTRVKSKVKPRAKPHLAANVSGIIIECPSEFSDDTTDYLNPKKASSSKPSDITTGSLNPNKALSSPTKSEMFDLDGPSDFTANLVDYMKGTKAFSPPARTSSSSKQLVGSKIPKTPEAKHDKGTINTINNIKSKYHARADSVIDSDLKPAPKMNQNLVTNGPSNFPTTLSAMIHGTSANPDPAQPDSKPKPIPRPMSSPAKSENFDVTGPSDFTENLVDYMKGTKRYSPYSKTSPTTIAATNTTTEAMNNTTNNNEVEDDLHKQIAQLQAQLVQKDDTITKMQAQLTQKDEAITELHAQVQKKDQTITKLQTQILRKNDTITDLQSSCECELLRDALGSTSDELLAQQSLAAGLRADNLELEGTIASLHQSQAEVEEKREKREEEWRGRADLLMQEVDRRGAVCLQLWGELENPGERDAGGRQKYTYKYMKKCTKGASLT